MAGGAGAAAPAKRPVEEGAGAAVEAPAKKRGIAFAEDTKPAAADGLKAPAPRPAGTAGGGAAAAGAAAPAVHSNQNIDVPVDFDGGRRCSKTGRWIGNGTWVCVLPSAICVCRQAGFLN